MATHDADESRPATRAVEPPADAGSASPEHVNPRSDGWTTDTTPTPEPQHVIGANARRSAEALSPEAWAPMPPGTPPERPLAPGVLEHTEDTRLEREQRQVDDNRGAEAHPAAQRPPPPTPPAHEHPHQQQSSRH